ncbi:Sodium-coupled monocarboxylate transporter 1 [Pseudolycoriella hygida]|uniref:Sodium-coupled monocarboxylate transporter 1 n=1 Tax=Pseudolycoriella hygida TaxID=35572 RepID=A0A9Q0RZE3_9DIPT|nr:Sodium-coupled monocarboxylate transporter 1 [Pseudolycoriella hygida]
MEKKLNAKELRQSLQNFGRIDYFVFIFSLIICAAVGLYFGFVSKNRKSKQNATEAAEEYLMGGRKMSVFPVAMSLAASFISAIALLGLVTEVYFYGTQYVFAIIPCILAGVICSYVYLPVFYELRLDTCCQYLEKRFDKRMRLFASILYALHTITFLPVVMYVPALAFNQVTGTNIHILSPIVCSICIFYTLVGGIKAVVWTDVIQMCVMMGTMLVIAAKGTVDANGFSNIWDKCWKGDRIVLAELTLDPTVRHSVFALVIGGTLYLTFTFSMNQSMIQRYLSLPTIRQARFALSIYIFSVSSIIVICSYAGLIVFALYSRCDPLTTKLIGAPDQMLPLLAMQTLGKYPGVVGLFVGGIFSAALSTMSTCLNSMAAVVLEDFCKPFVKTALTKKQTDYLMRATVFVVGIASTLLVFVVEKLGTVLQLQMSITGASAGPVFAVYTMGVLMPCVKRKGAFYGGICGVLAMFFILFNAQADIASGNLKFPKKYVYTDRCDYDFDLTAFMNQTLPVDTYGSSFKIHRVSYLFYTLIGAVVTIVVSIAVSLLFDSGPVADAKFFSPVIRKFIPTPRNSKDCVITKNSVPGLCCDFHKSLQLFGWVDYAIFFAMLLSSALVGVYFGYVEKLFKRKKVHGNDHESEVAQEYLMGNRQMSVIPVALSLVASWFSGISLLGLTTEIYLYGTAYAFITVAWFIAGILVGIFYLPVFYNLQLKSLSEYLEMRFDKRLRLLSSILYVIGAISYLPVVIYVPALAFNQVAGANVHIITAFICFICIFYTLVGGIKAVVFSDCIQTFIMVGSLIVIIVKGTIDLNGFEAVWMKNKEGERINFPELTLDVTARHSVISLLLGGLPHLLTTCIMSQSMTQRYLSLPTLKHANYALVIFIVLLCALITICCYSGLLAYAFYSDCDPLKTKLINAQDQLLPLLVMFIFGNSPGLPGLFVAGIFSASLSTLSTHLNSMAAVVLEDFYKPFANRPLTERQTSCLMRSVVFVMGLISFCLVFVVQNLGTVLQLSMSLGGMTHGPTFGIFTMGLMCPWVNKRGAFTGGIVGIAAMIWIVANAQSDIASGILTFQIKPVDTDNCEYNFSDVRISNTTIIHDYVSTSFQVHHISYLFYTILGGLTTTAVGSAVSLLCEEKMECDMDPMLFSPFVRKFINSRKLLSIRPDVKEKSSVIHAFEIKDTQL